MTECKGSEGLLLTMKCYSLEVTHGPLTTRRLGSVFRKKRVGGINHRTCSVAKQGHISGRVMAGVSQISRHLGRLISPSASLFNTIGFGARPSWLKFGYCHELDV